MFTVYNNVIKTDTLFLINGIMEKISTFVARIGKDGSHVDGQAGGGERELPESRANGRGRSLAVIVDRAAGWRAGGRACDTTNNVRTGHWMDRTKGGRTRQNLCSCRYSIRSLASNTTIGHKFKGTRLQKPTTLSILGKLTTKATQWHTFGSSQLFSMT